MTAPADELAPADPPRRRRRRRRRADGAVESTVISIDLFIAAEDVEDAPPLPQAGDETPAAELQAIARELTTREQSVRAERVLLQDRAFRLREEVRQAAKELEAHRRRLARWEQALATREAELVRREHAAG